MRLITSLLRRASSKTMLEIERVRQRQGSRAFAYAFAAASVAVVIALLIFDASGMAITEQSAIQRAKAW
jgi:hypothetical protein